MWILLIVLYGTPMAEQAGAAIHSAKFDSENTCEIAAAKVRGAYEKDMSVNVKTMCVKS